MKTKMELKKQNKKPSINLEKKDSPWAGRTRSGNGEKGQSPLSEEKKRKRSEKDVVDCHVQKKKKMVDVQMPKVKSKLEATFEEVKDDMEDRFEEVKDDMEDEEVVPERAIISCTKWANSVPKLNDEKETQMQNSDIEKEPGTDIEKYEAGSDIGEKEKAGSDFKKGIGGTDIGEKEEAGSDFEKDTGGTDIGEKKEACTDFGKDEALKIVCEKGESSTKNDFEKEKEVGKKGLEDLIGLNENYNLLLEDENSQKEEFEIGNEKKEKPNVFYDEKLLKENYHHSVEEECEKEKVEKNEDPETTPIK